MAITFNNVIYDRVIDNLHSIIANEFGIQIFYDEHKGNQSFLIEPVSDDLNEQIALLIDAIHKLGGVAS